MNLANDPIFTIFVTALLVSILAILLHRRSTKLSDAELQRQVELTKNAERQIHLQEMEFLSERNKVQLTHLEEITDARAVAFEEGKKQGKAEYKLESSIRLADQRNEFAVRLLNEREEAAVQARDRQRAEHELQAKLFSVKISPYVQILTDNGVFRSVHEAKVGYQYQSLVNGIPAFQPHVIFERQEKVLKVDEEIKRTLLAIAQTCAEAAATTYLGASPQFAKLSPSVFEQVAR